MKDIIKTVGSIVIVSSIFALGIFSFSSIAAIPDVRVSHSTNECVTVINYEEDDQYSCTDMPSKYNMVWVK